MTTDVFVIRTFVIGFFALAFLLNAAWVFQAINGGDFPQTLQYTVSGVDALIVAGIGAVLGVSKFGGSGGSS